MSGKPTMSCICCRSQTSWRPRRTMHLQQHSPARPHASFLTTGSSFTTGWYRGPPFNSASNLASPRARRFAGRAPRAEFRSLILRPRARRGAAPRDARGQVRTRRRAPPSRRRRVAPTGAAPAKRPARYALPDRVSREGRAGRRGEPCRAVAALYGTQRRRRCRLSPARLCVRLRLHRSLTTLAPSYFPNNSAPGPQASGP